MAAGAGYYDANGVYKYGETDNIGLVSDLLNIGMDSVSNSITNLTSGILTAWTTYTPTFTNFTLGNGSVVARYKQVGKTVFVYCKVVTGSTTNFTGTPVITLPVAMRQGSFLMGSASLTNGSGIYPFVPNASAGTNVALYATLTNGTYGVYTGWVGALSTSAGANLEFNMVYEAS